MFRFLRNLVLVSILAALAGLAFVVMQSSDPEYTLREWAEQPNYWAYDHLITEAARKRGLDPMLVKAVVWRESKFRPDMVGTSGERGLMQVTEGAAQDWAKAEKIETFVPTDLFDPANNLQVGVWYLSKAGERWKDRDDPVPFMLAEYNAGKTRVDRWIALSGSKQFASARDLLANMDFPTTRKYIEDIQARYRFYKERGRL